MNGESKQRDMYEFCDTYFREQLAHGYSGVLGQAPENDPQVCKQYQKILTTPGLGYEFRVEDFGELAQPPWEWQTNRRIEMQINNRDNVED